MTEPLTTAAREAIRIAETYLPDDLRRQADLAKEIVAAINLCEAELGEAIVRRIVNWKPQIH